jgi:formate hydrogenlyase subunit 3/multisubunit Na+/H+ antiporter MnhD subunit
MVWVLAAALLTLIAGGLLDLIVGVSRAPVRAGVYLLAAAASVLLGVVGANGLAGHAVRLGLGAVLGEGALSFGSVGLAVDRLGGLFLLLTAVTALPVCLVCAAWAARPGRIAHRGLGGACTLCLGAVALIVTSDNVFLFVLAWELLTIAFYLLAGFNRADPRHTGDSLITVVFGKVSGAAILLGFLLLAGAAHSFGFNDLAALPRSPLRDVAFALLVAGFAVKVGLVPVHVWMPRGYQAAPGPLRAVMAGVAVNVGFYGMWRTLALLRVPPGWLAVTVLLIGGITALLGIAHATTHTDLAGVIAYSSVENGGLICVGYGVALIGAAVAQPGVVAVGILAASLQMVGHAFGKSLLFTSTAAIEDAAGSTELQALRGVAHRLPASGTGLAVGALTLAGLPLTVGFVSEWFLLESLMQQFRVGHLGYALPMALAGALVALTVGFAAVAFVRVIGLTVLGPQPARTRVRALDVGWSGGVGLTLLALGCVGLAAIGPLLIRLLAAGLSPVVPRGITAGSLKSPWVLQPVYPEFSAVSPSWLALAMPVLFLAVFVVSAALGRERMFAVRRVPAWRSATDGVAGESHYTPFAFANPTRKVLATVLLTRSALAVSTSPSGGDADAPYDSNSQSAVTSVEAAERISHTADVAEVSERYLYSPAIRLLIHIARTAKSFQNGRLDAYLAYMLIALIAVLAVVAGLA